VLLIFFVAREMTVIMLTLGEIIRKRRGESGLSQEKLGKLTGCKPLTIMNIENGRTVPTNETIWILGAALCFFESDILNLLKLAKYQRENRVDLQRAYAIKLAEKILKRSS